MAKFYERVMAGAYENRVLPFLWQKGESREVIAEYLERIAAADIREVCLESRPHPDFMGEGWWSDLGFIIERCRGLGLKIWLLDDAHFPTGYANGALEGLAADDSRRKTVLTHRTLDVVGPTPCMSVKLANPFDDTERFYGAVALRDGRPVPVKFELVRGDGSTGAVARAAGADAFMGTASVGGSPDRLVFDAPEGHTRIVLMFTSRKTGFRDGYINMVDKASCDMLIDAVYEPHYRRFGEEFGKTILGFFTDEPGFMNAKGGVDAGGNADTLIGKGDMPLPWSDELERRLRAELGADYLAQLPLLWGREPQGARVRHAYMDIATRLYRECFDENVGSWCRARGVMHIGHVIEDKGCHTRLGVGAGHYFRAVAGQDMAGVDIVINQLVPGVDEGFHSYGRGMWDMEFFTYALARLGSSAAHIDPRKQGRCMAEVFGAFGWHEGLKEMKWIADHFLVRGVNWFVPHAFSQASFPDVDCPPHFYAHGNNPQFRHFGALMSYMNRVGTLLSNGAAHTEAAVLYHADAEWAGEAMPVQKVARELTRAQIGFDFVPEDALCGAEGYAVELIGPDDSTAEDAHAATGFAVNGQVYRCLILPHVALAGTGALAFAARAAAAGVPVYAVDGLPVGTYDGDTAEVAGFAPLGADALAGVQAVALDALAKTLAAAGLREVEVADAQPWLRAYRYSRQGEEYLFLANEHPKRAIRTELPNVRGAALDLLNLGAPRPFDGTLELAPYESVLVVLGEEPARLAASDADDAAVDGRAERIELADGWQVAHAAPLDYPTFGEPHRLDALVDLSTTLFCGKSGTFRYERAFDLDADTTVTLAIDEAYETVEVFVDDAPVGVRIAPPYRMELGRLAAGGHRLAIEVTNTLDKQVLDMFSLTEPSEPTGIIGAVALELR